MAGDARTDLGDAAYRDGRHRGTPPRGVRQLTALLPNGRTVWFRVDAPLAPAASVNDLAHRAENAGLWRDADARAQRRALDRLAKTVETDAERLEEARLARARARRRRLAAADNRLDRRLSKARDELRTRLDKQLTIDRESVRRLGRRDLWDKILIATALPLFAAYGQRDSPFGRNNLTLALSLLIFLVGDEVVEAVFGSDRPAAPHAVHDADAWSYLAPIANVAAGWWLLGGSQHQRFITGIAPVRLAERTPRSARAGTLTYRFETALHLTRRVTPDAAPAVAPDHAADFETFKEVPAVATIRTVDWSADGKALAARIAGVSARVDAGVLKLSVLAVVDAPTGNRLARRRAPDLGAVDIAWMVDTKPSTPAHRN